jgi:hypothetical protein
MICAGPDGLKVRRAICPKKSQKALSCAIDFAIGFEIFAKITRREGEFSGRRNAGESILWSYPFFVGAGF